MKNKLLIYILTFIAIFSLVGCSCKKDEKITKETAINVLKDSRITTNVMITTTTTTNVNDKESSSIQEDIYYNNMYYHASDTTNLSTKTWYGYVDDTLYAFYYTKNENNNETKTSSRIDKEVLDSTKNQPNATINSLFSEDGNLIENYDVVATKKNKTYTIQITNSKVEESDTYTFTIKDNKVYKLVKTSSTTSNNIKVVYDYNYNVSDINLPNISEYPLKTNN